MRQTRLAKLDGWREVEGRDAITKSFRFATFAQAFHFMTSVAAEAERLNHHPEWTNIYNRVEVTLATHETTDGTPGVTDYDIALAAFMNSLAPEIRSDAPPKIR